jgi:hypothetical protein
VCRCDDGKYMGDPHNTLYVVRIRVAGADVAGFGCDLADGVSHLVVLSGYCSCGCYGVA